MLTRGEFMKGTAGLIGGVMLGAYGQYTEAPFEVYNEITPEIGKILDPLISKVESRMHFDSFSILSNGEQPQCDSNKWAKTLVHMAYMSNGGGMKTVDRLVDMLDESKLVVSEGNTFWDDINEDYAGSITSGGVNKIVIRPTFVQGYRMDKERQDAGDTQIYEALFKIVQFARSGNPGGVNIELKSIEIAIGAGIGGILSGRSFSRRHFTRGILTLCSVGAGITVVEQFVDPLRVQAWSEARKFKDTLNRGNFITFKKQ